MGDTDEAYAGQNIPPPALSMMGDIEGPGAGLFFVTQPFQTQHGLRYGHE